MFLRGFERGLADPCSIECTVERVRACEHLWRSELQALSYVYNGKIVLHGLPRPGSLD